MASRGDADGLGGEDHPGQVDEGAARRRAARWPAAPSSVTRAVRRVGSRLAGTVDGDAVAHLDDGDVVARRRTSSTLASPPPSTTPASPEALPSVTVTSPSRATAPATEPSAKPGQELGLGGVVAGGDEHGAGDHGGHERAGRDGAAELLDDDDELLEAVARAAVLLGDVEARASRGRRRSFQKSGQLLGRAPRAARGPRRGRRASAGSRTAVSARARWSSVMAIDMVRGSPLSLVTRVACVAPAPYGIAAPAGERGKTGRP